MMGIRPINVCMGQLFMHMEMVVSLRIILFAVWVTVMIILVMRMLVAMCDHFVNMGMLMTFPAKT